MSVHDPNSPIPATPLPALASESSTTSDLVKVVGQFVGAIAAVAGTIYLVGTLVLLVRLAWTRGVSGVGQIPQLSRDVLLALGLEVILIPLGIGVGYAIFRAILRKPEHAPPTPDHRVRLWSSAALLALIAAPALGAWTNAATDGHANIGIAWKWTIGVGILAVAVGLTWLTTRAWERLGESYAKEAQEAYPNDDEHRERDLLASKRWNSMGAIMIVSLLFGAANVPSWAFVAMSVPLGHALVCPKSGEAGRGYLVGEGGSRTYLALYHGHTIVSFPNDQVVRVLTGDESDLTSCPPAPTS